MPKPPTLAFACPVPWETMQGDERQKFCTQCGCHVTNLSLLSHQDREALLERAKTERICGTYWLRLSGEMVTPEEHPTPSAHSHIPKPGTTETPLPPPVLDREAEGMIAILTGIIERHHEYRPSPVHPQPRPPLPPYIDETDF